MSEQVAPFPNVFGANMLCKAENAMRWHSWFQLSSRNLCNFKQQGKCFLKSSEGPFICQHGKISPLKFNLNVYKLGNKTKQVILYYSLLSGNL